MVRALPLLRFRTAGSSIWALIRLIDQTSHMDGFEVSAIRNAYDAVADDYVLAFADDLDQLPTDRAFLDATAELVSGSGRVLDLGCGPGQVAGYLVDRGVQVVGLDLSTRMLDHSSERTPRAKYTCGDMRHLPYAAGSFSAVVAFYTIQHLPRLSLDGALSEMSRVLAVGGCLVVAAHLGVGETYMQEFLGHRTDPVGGTFYSEAELEESLGSNGYSVQLTRHRDPLNHEHPSKRIYIIATTNGEHE